MAGWVVALFLVTQATHGLGANAADTLFFSRFGVEHLPWMIVLAGVAVMLMVLSHTAGLASLGERSWLPIVTAASAVWVLGEWLGVLSEARFVYAAVWISTQGIIMLTFTMMWNAAGAAVTTRQAKRLFPLFATAGVVGGTVGNLVTGPIAAIFGTESLLLAQAVLLLVSTFLVVRVRDFVSRPEVESDGSTVVEALKSAMRSVRGSRLMLLAAVVALLTWALFYLVVFAFSESVAASFQSESAMAGFLGLFASIVTATTFLVSLVVAKRMFARIGIILSLLLLPVVYAAGFAVWLADFSLATAALVRGIQWVTLNAIGATAFTALFNVLTGSRRAQVVAFMTAVPAQLGTIAGGLLLIASRGISDTARFTLGLVLSLATIGVVAAMRPAYIEAVVDAVRKGLTGVFNAPTTGLGALTDRDAVLVLQRRLSAERPGERAFALATLASLPEREMVGDVSTYLSDPSPEVRAAAFDAVCALDPSGFERHGVMALEDPSPEMRVRGLRYAFDSGSTEAALMALQDPDPFVRAVAAVSAEGEAGETVAREIAGGTDPEAKKALLAEMLRLNRRPIDVGQLLEDSDAGVRELAVRVSALGELDANALRQRLDDRSRRVRRASAEALSTTDRGRQLLVDVLQSGTVNETDAALEALVPFDELDGELADWAMGEAKRAAHLDRLGRALADAADTVTGAFLKRVLFERVGRLEEWVLMAMTTRDTLETMALVRKGLRSTDIETQAEAMEALETVGDRRVLGVLMPLIESAHGSPDLDARGALRVLTTDFDPWLRALSTRCLAEQIESDLTDLSTTAGADSSDLVREIVPTLSVMSDERSDVLGIVDRVLALQGVAMFSDLDPEDLELLAGSATETLFEPREPIYREGVEGDEALVIVDGSAHVTVERDGQVIDINTYGAGDTVGELALLRAGVRSADVTAGDEGVHGLVITKEDLLSFLEERPSVAIGMLTTLAERLVEET